ncbi:MAG: LytTR family DNA-binding domain-containing protein [Bacteroidota bacterium]
MINCIITDDEPLAREGLAQYVQDIDFLNLAGIAENPLETMAIMEEQSVDLLFLDIQMPKLNGLDFLKSLDHPPLVIITTAYPSFALEGYQLDVLDYLVKPITFQRFLKACFKAKKQFELMQGSQSSKNVDSQKVTTKEHFFIKCDGKIERIRFDELLYVESMQNYVSLQTERGKFTTLLTLKNTLAELPASTFMQVHKSFIVNLEKVQTLGDGHIRIKDRLIPISRSRLSEVNQRILGDDLIN